MTLDELCELASRDQESPFGLWTRNLRRDRDQGSIDAALCDRIADALKEHCERRDFAAVPKVLEQLVHDGLRLRRRTKCSAELSLVSTVATVGRYYADKMGYASNYDDLVERCEQDIKSERLVGSTLRGPLRGKLHYAWFTDAERLDSTLSEYTAASSETHVCEADVTRNVLGLNYKASERLVRIDVQLPSDATCAVAAPTTLDAAGHPYFLASPSQTEHGWTLDLQARRRALPEWVISGLDASCATGLRVLGATASAPTVNWGELCQLFDQGVL